MSDGMQYLCVYIPDMQKDGHGASVGLHYSGDVFGPLGRAELCRTVHDSICALCDAKPPDSKPEWLDDPDRYSFEEVEERELSDPPIPLPEGVEREHVKWLRLRELVAA